MDFTKPIALIVTDLETMGKKPGCIVTEIGARVVVTELPNEVDFSFAEIVDYAASKKAGFRADKGTIDWWAEKLELDHLPNRKAKEQMFAAKWRSPHSIRKSIEHFTSFYNDVVTAVGDKNQVLLMGNDIDFDKAILEHYYLACNKPIPWHYRAWVSLPTMVWLVGMISGIDVKKVVRESWKTTHNAMDDANQEATMVRMALDVIRGVRYTSEVKELNEEK